MERDNCISSVVLFGDSQTYLSTNGTSFKGFAHGLSTGVIQNTIFFDGDNFIIPTSNGVAISSNGQNWREFNMNYYNGFLMDQGTGIGFGSLGLTLVRLGKIK